LQSVYQVASNVSVSLKQNQLILQRVTSGRDKAEYLLLWGESFVSFQQVQMSRNENREDEMEDRLEREMREIRMLKQIFVYSCSLYLSKHTSLETPREDFSERRVCHCCYKQELTGCQSYIMFCLYWCEHYTDMC